MISTVALIAALLSGGGEPVTALTVVPNNGRTDVLVSVTGNVTFRAFTMEGPHRLILDVMNARHALPREIFTGVNRGGILAVRTSQYSEDIVRIVVELNQPAEYTIEQYDGTIQISLENRFGDFDPWETASVPTVIAPEPEGTRTEAFASLSLKLQPAPQQSQAARISITFINTPIEDVLFTFADFSGRSIVPSSQVTSMTVTAEIKDQAWDEALSAILRQQGLRGDEDGPSGIIRVDLLTNINLAEDTEPLRTEIYQINYGTAAEVLTAVIPLQTARGNASSAPATNTLIVTDIERVHAAIRSLLIELDRPTPQVMISAKIIFVNRTDLNEFGIVYDLKDSQGNQFSQVTPALADLDGDGELEAQTKDVVLLGGNSVAALGNAKARVVGPTLSLLTSLVIGRHTLVGFIEALESSNLSDIQAAPSVTVADNQTARLQVGERTPVRVIDAQAGGTGGAGAGFPRATVRFEETGIILTTTPHITAGGYVLMDIRAERSAADFADSDIGVIFRTQNATTRVLVRDGETVVIGGLTVTERSEVRAGVPILMNLPVVGRLFRVTRVSETQRDLMILVTPHIVRGDAN
ncbi:MAG: AMIN domain-containing protein [Longimicrobiales bacterium]